MQQADQRGTASPPEPLRALLDESAGLPLPYNGLALDRAVRIATARGDRRRARQLRWTAARDAVADDIRSRGVDAAHDTYTGAYGSAALDAAVLLPVLEFEPTTSPRVVATVDVATPCSTLVGSACSARTPSR